MRWCDVCCAAYRSDFERCPIDGSGLVIGSVDPLIGQTIAEHYLIEELIGEGAMGRVYRAHHTRLTNKRYALKILLGDLAASATMRMRFANEAESTSKLSHPNIVGVLDFGRTEAGLMYLVMELVEGPTLGDVVFEGPMPPSRVVRLARQLCEGLAHAHQRGVVHRDFKPDNILLVGDRDDELARIADLGLAISVSEDDARLTTSGVLCTPAYAAPEQLLNSNIDARVDLYALGVTMFEMLTGGILPFPGDPQSAMARKLTLDAPAVLSIAPETPAALAAVIDCLLARDRTKRLQTAEAVIDALANPRVSTPQMQTAPTMRAPAVRPPRHWRQHPAVLSLVGAAMLVGAWHFFGADRVAIEAPAIAIADVQQPMPKTSAQERAPARSEPQVAPPPPIAPPVRVARRAVGGRPSPPKAQAGIEPSLVAVASELAAPLVEALEPDVPLPAPPPPAAETAPPPGRSPVVIPPAASARLVSFDVAGALPASVIRRAVERVFGDLRQCADQGGPRVVFAKFTIRETRRATGIEVTGAGARCVSAALDGIRTEVAPDVGDAEVRLSIAFGATP